MDPFRKLPAELRLTIIFRLGHSSELLALSHASPAIYQQSRVSSKKITRHFRCKDLTDSQLQDAMAILLFPETNFSPEDYPLWAKTISCHMKEWGEKKLPNPFEASDTAMMEDLDSLIAQVTLYMEDYITKATSPHMHRAYIQLPQWAHSTFSRDVGPQLAPLPSVPCSKLNLDERNRLLEAFLRYELLCKIFCPRPRKTPRQYDNFAEFLWVAHVYPQFAQWSWTLLEWYERPHPKVDTRAFIGHEPQDGDPRDIELLQCVGEYVRTLYGAMAVRVKHGGWFISPDLKQQSTPVSSSSGPDRDQSFHTDRDAYFNDFWGYSRGVEYGFDCQLAACGFNVLTELLTSEQSSCEEFFRCFTIEAYSGNPVYIDSTPMRTREETATRDYHRWSRRYSEAPDGGKRWLKHRLVRTSRQRAWALFDSGRVYPSSSEYSRLKDYEARERWFWDRYNEPAEGEHPPEYDWIFSNNRPHYLSLTKRINKSFWER